MSAMMGSRPASESRRTARHVLSMVLCYSVHPTELIVLIINTLIALRSTGSVSGSAGPVVAMGTMDGARP